MTSPTHNKPIRCAIYTRKSSEEGLEQDFNSLDAQREACEAYIKSQLHEGWILDDSRYDDGGFSGGSMDRPALVRLMEDIESGLIDIIVVYKVDRLSRSLADFSKMVESFDQFEVSFVSITQQFNTSTSMGRLTLNVLLSFAQFEREVTGERIRDKIAASKKKGMWMGGTVPIGYDVQDRALIINHSEAATVRHIYERYLALGSVRELKGELDHAGIVSKIRVTNDKQSGGNRFYRGALYTLLKNPIYVGKVSHKGKLYPGQHQAILEPELWQSVQNRLSANRRHKQLRTNSKIPSLLSGLLFDDRGNPMSPSHATKKNLRYRYYVSQALPQYRAHEGGSVVRIPAKTVEDLVTNQLATLLGDGNRLLDTLAWVDATAVQQEQLITAAQALSAEWNHLSPAQQIRHLQTSIRNITIGMEAITLSLSRSGIKKMFLPDVDQDKSEDKNTQDEIELTIPARLKRCGIETKLIVPGGKKTLDAHPSSVEAIQKAVGKALTWNQALVSGSVGSMSALAKKNQISQRHVSKVIRLAYLAPDIIEAIFKGRIPRKLSMIRLKEDIPLDWEEQRKEFGFSR